MLFRLLSLVIAFGLWVPAARGLRGLPEFQPSPLHLRFLSRTASILHGSASGNPRDFKVIFYGQSITLFPWWNRVAQGLQTRFPHVRFVIENRAIPGFAADRLAETVTADVVQAQPDLVIFHSYGQLFETERLLATIRLHTTAEVLVQSDHLHLTGQLDEETDPTKTAPQDWWAYRNAVWLPALCDRYGCCLADVRSFWKGYLRHNQLKESDLLGDWPHPNEEGNEVMSMAVLSYFEAPPLEPTTDAFNTPTVRMAEVSLAESKSPWVLEADFHGTRVDWIPQDIPDACDVAVWIDGRAPSALEGPTAFGRTSYVEGTYWPAIQRIDSRALLLEETWTLTLTEIAPNAETLRFQLEGSRTGFDGVGSNETNFLSHSGRVFIDKKQWFIPSAFRGTGQLPKIGSRVTWEAQFRGRNECTTETLRRSRQDGRWTLAAGLSDGPHRLRLVFRSPVAPGRNQLVAYSPTGNASVRTRAWGIPEFLSALTLRRAGSQGWVIWPHSNGKYRLEGSGRLGPEAEWVTIPDSYRLSETISGYEFGNGDGQRFFRVVTGPNSQNPSRVVGTGALRFVGAASSY